MMIDDHDDSDGGMTVVGKAFPKKTIKNECLGKPDPMANAIEMAVRS